MARDSVILYDQSDDELVQQIITILKILGFNNIREVQLDQEKKKELNVLLDERVNFPCVYINTPDFSSGNESCPQPQSSEHLAAIEIMKLIHMIILQNKIDLVKETQAKKQHEQIVKITRFIKGKKLALISGLTGITAILAIPIFLYAFGFTAVGVAAHSLASTVCSSFYGGSTTGVFSLLQSAGAAGLGTSTNAVIGAGTAALFGYFGGKSATEPKAGIKPKADIEPKPLYHSLYHLTLQVFAFCRIQEYEKDCNNITEYLFNKFAIKDDEGIKKIKFDYPKESQFNWLVGEKRHSNPAPACFISINRNKEFIKSNL